MVIPAPKELFGKAGRAWLAQLELPPLVRGEIDTLLRLIDARAIEWATSLLLHCPRAIKLFAAHALADVSNPAGRYSGRYAPFGKNSRKSNLASSVERQNSFEQRLSWGDIALEVRGAVTRSSSPGHRSSRRLCCSERP
jgi:hypothetical protein